MENCELKRKFLSKIVVKPNFILRSQFSDDGYIDDDDNDDDDSDTIYFSSVLYVSDSLLGSL